MDFRLSSLFLENAVEYLRLGDFIGAYTEVYNLIAEEEDDGPPTVRTPPKVRSTLPSMKAATVFAAAPKGDKAAKSPSVGIPSLAHAPAVPDKTKDWHKRMFDKYSSKPADR